MISVNKAYTPELPPEVLERLRDDAELLRDDVRYKTQHAWSGVYLRGLLPDGERKSIEPMVARVPRPPELLDIQDPEQALQQFVTQSPWDEQKVCQRHRAVMAQSLAGPRGIFVIDDTGSPKPGQHSVGVPRQYGGRPGKEANGQVAVTVHDVSPKGHFPAAWRLYLPKSGTSPPQRLEGVGVPEEYRRERTKGQIALDLLDQVRDEGLLPGDIVLTDAGYGVSQSFGEGWEQRQLFSLAGVTPEMVVFTAEPRWGWPEGRPTRGRPRSRPHLAVDNPRPVSLRSLAESRPRRQVTGREGTKGELSVKFAWVRVRPGQGWAEGAWAGAEALWLSIEGRADGKIQYAFSNLPACTRRIPAARLWKSRGPVEEGYQPMKEGLGLNHFEGRSWRGFHHHACLGMLSYGSLVLEQLRAKESPAKPGKKRQPAAQDHRPGDPPRPAATASADGSAGLRLL